MRVKSPVRGVMEVKVLDQSVVGRLNIEQTRPALFSDEVTNAGLSPPYFSIAF
jgi:hypothetical protein